MSYIDIMHSLNCVPADLYESAKLLIGQEARVKSTYLNNPQFSDDIGIFSNSGDELQQMIEDLKRESIRVGFKIIMWKTKLMSNSQAKEQELMIACQTLEITERYVYLSELPTGYPDHDKEIYSTKMGWAA